MDHSAPALADVRPAFRAAAGHLPSGVAVVVATIAGEPHAATAGSVVVASADPPLLAVFFAAGGRMHRALAAEAAFTVNLLRQADHGLARHFANPARATGWTGLSNAAVRRRDPALPLLANAAAWFDCRVRQIVPVGDHACVVGEVAACGRDPRAPPLLYHRGRFHGLGGPAAPAPWSTLARADLGAEW